MSREFPYKSAHICSGGCGKNLIVKNAQSKHLLQIGKPMKCDTCRRGFDVSRMPYKTYLKTDHWLKRARDCRLYWGNRCALCNDNAPLEVHHRTYERLGRETDTDIIALCRECHKKFHTVEEEQEKQTV